MEETKRRGRPPGKKVENLDLKPWPNGEQLVTQTVQQAPTFQHQTQTYHQPPQTYQQPSVGLPQGRNFATQTNFMHDLFKLKVAVMLRNDAVFENDTDLVKLEHCHLFHTITSDGKKQTRSSSIGGHFHKIEVIEQGEGLPPKVRCLSGPLKEVTKLIRGKRVKVEVPANDFDEHTHEIEYERSNVILERTRNVEAAKAEAQISARFQGSNSFGISSDDN